LCDLGQIPNLAIFIYGDFKNTTMPVIHKEGISYALGLIQNHLQYESSDIALVKGNLPQNISTDPEPYRQKRKLEFKAFADYIITVLKGHVVDSIRHLESEENQFLQVMQIAQTQTESRFIEIASHFKHVDGRLHHVLGSIQTIISQIEVLTNTYASVLDGRNNQFVVISSTNDVLRLLDRALRMFEAESKTIATDLESIITFMHDFEINLNNSLKVLTKNEQALSVFANNIKSWMH
jgi:hypothetical protein